MLKRWISLALLAGAVGGRRRPAGFPPGDTPWTRNILVRDPAGTHVQCFEARQRRPAPPGVIVRVRYGPTRWT